MLLLLLLLSHFSRVRHCNPIDGIPPGSPVPGILQARTLEWVAISFSNAWKWKVKVKSLSRVPCPTLHDPMDCSLPGSSLCGMFQTFELSCWRRLLRVPWTARRSNQSILKKISPEYALEGLMLKLKFQYFGHLMRRTDFWKRPWCWERLKAGGEGDNRSWDGWMASLTQWAWVCINSRSWWWTGKSGVLQSMGSQGVGNEQLNWTKLMQ